MSVTTIDTPEGIRMFGLLQIAHRLALEVNTGMGFRQSSLAAAKRAGLTTKSTKKGALRDVIGVIQEANPAYEPGDTIVRALA